MASKQPKRPRIAPSPSSPLHPISDAHAASSGGADPPPLRIHNVAAEGSLPPVAVAAQSPPPLPASARRNLGPALAEEEEGGDSGKGEAAGEVPPPKGASPLPARSNEAPPPLQLQATGKSPTKSKKKKKKNNKKKTKKKEALLAGDSGSGKAAAEGEGKMDSGSASAAETEPQQGGEQDSEEDPLPQQRKSKRVATSSHNHDAPDPKKTKIIVEGHSSAFQQHQWNANDEIMILEALVEHIHNGGELPQEHGHPLFHDLAQRLEGGGSTFDHHDVWEKVHMLKRRYDDVVITGAAPTMMDHERQLNELSCEVWGRSDAHAMDKQRSLAMDEDMSFDEMCKRYPLLAQELKLLVEEHPNIGTLFTRLDDNRAAAIEKKLDNVRWMDIRRHNNMEVKMTKVRNELICWLEKLRS